MYMTSNSYDIALIGCGKMGQAMLSAWLDQGLVNTCYIIDPHGIPAKFESHPSVQHCTAQSLRDLNINLSVLAVKPQILADVCLEVSQFLKPSTVILSIAAGKSMRSLENLFAPNTPIIRSMPNTPASVGKGMCVCIANTFINRNDKLMASSLLEANGRVEWIEDEALMDAVTALSGSGPAYVFHLIEVLAKSGETMGLSPETSMTLARQTVIGSACLAEKDAEIAAHQLRENVTSPNGTTHAALTVLMDGRLDEIYKEALMKASHRSKELNS